MNKKLYFLSFVLLSSLAISSCAVKETKVETSAGNNMVITSFDNTVNKMKSLYEDSFFSLQLQGSSTSYSKLDVIAVSQETSSYTQTIENNASNLIELFANFNTSNINSTPASLEGTELYLKQQNIDSSKIYTTPSLGFDIEKNSDIYYEGLIKDNVSYNYSKIDNVEDSSQEIMDQEDAEDFAEQLQDLINLDFELFDNGIENDLITIDLSTLFSKADEEEFKQKHYEFLKGDLSSEEYCKYLISVMDEPTEEIEQELLDALNFTNQCNPFKYLEYTKVKKDNLTTLSSSLDYQRWKDDIYEFHKTIHKEGDTSLECLSHILYRLVPSNVNFNFSISTNKDNVITSLSYDINIKGAIPSIVLTKILGSGILGALDVNYDLSLSGSYSLNLKSEKLVVKTVEEFLNNQK